MRIAIACSKNWFTVSDCLKEHHEVFWIRTQSELTEDALANFQPDYVFFPIGAGWLRNRSILNLTVSFFIQRLYLTVAVVAPFKTLSYAAILTRRFVLFK